MRSCLAAGLVSLLGLMLQVRPTQALQFEQVSISPTEVIVGGRGPIIKGDTERLQHALAAVGPGRRILALALDSPGGNVAEGELLARLIREQQLTVLIPSNSKCVSVCFLLLGAALHRYAAADALIGVHSASENGAETDSSLAMTTLMARDASEMGIPSAIIGKMVGTAPGRVEWLDQDDLALMNVTVFEGDPRSAVHEPSSTTVAPAPLVSPVQPPSQQVPASSAFRAGRDDRRVWNAWLIGLSGPYRDGAVFAQTQVGLPHPGSCYGQRGGNRGDFTSGCGLGRKRLAPIEAKIRANADYANGWNSVGQAIPANEPVEVEYRGAYFCGQQLAHLTLRVFPRQGDLPRRAVFIFAPQPTSPEVPRGAFIVEGSIDLLGGTLSLTPVSWVSQPEGYSWLGLQGSSTDGGKTFRGPVTGSSTCTNFTLQRVSNTSASR
jgi:hypothetical protein